MLNSKYKRIGTLAFLLIGLIFTTTSAFAYWREVTISNDVEIVKIGEPIDLVVTDLNTDDQSVYLVPSGYAMFVNDVEEVTLKYKVGVTRELLNSVNLIVSVIDINIGGDDSYSHLIDIDIMDGQDIETLDLYNEDIEIFVTVRLIEPIDEAEAIEKGLDLSLVNVSDSKRAYEAIKGQAVSFGLRFELQKKN